MTLLGACYCHGIMDGEALQLRSELIIYKKISDLSEGSV